MIIGYAIVALLMAGPPLFGVGVGFAKAPKLIVPGLVSLVSVAFLGFNLWIWIKPEGPCHYHECLDEDALAAAYSVITLVWWSFAGGVGYLTTLLGRTLRDRHDATLAG